MEAAKAQNWTLDLEEKKCTMTDLLNIIHGR
jgi:hypothetical protein